MRISGPNQPQIMFRPKRPLPMWSIVTACLAANSGCTVGRCEVAMVAICRVEAATAAAQV